MDQKLLQETYLGKQIIFTPDVWINATQTVKVLEAKRLDGFINSKYFTQYLDAYCKFHNIRHEDVVIKVKGGDTRTDYRNPVIGQGTFLHPDLVVLFARWINPKFAVWCDAIIKQILTGEIELKYKKVQQELQQDFDQLEDQRDKLFEELRLYQRPEENNDTPQI